MKTELENKLIEKYPMFFDYLKDIKKTPILPIYFGFECGDGWYWLLDNLMCTIDNYIKNNSKQKRIKNKYYRYIHEYLRKWMIKLPHKYSKQIKKIRNYIGDNALWEDYDSISQVNITQVKEKFGTLRFYYDGGNDIIDGMVWLAEHQSGEICDTCGTTENTYQTKGWIKTTCEKCTPRNTNT